jgi:hypothetical protein
VNKGGQACIIVINFLHLHEKRYIVHDFLGEE